MSNKPYLSESTIRAPKIAQNGPYTATGIRMVEALAKHLGLTSWSTGSPKSPPLTPQSAALAGFACSFAKAHDTFKPADRHVEDPLG